MTEKIAIQLYTLTDRLQTPADIAESMKKLRPIGYPAVQASGLGPIDPKEFKAICDDLQFIICSTHTAYEELMNDLDAVIAKHHLWNCKHIAVPSVPQHLRCEKGYLQFANEMSRVGEKLLAEGMTLSYHNHAFEFQKYGDKTALELIYENSDPRYLQGEIDTYWIQYGGGDPIQWCRKLSGRLPIVHLKDYGIIDNTPTFMEVGKGNLNWPEILKACEQAGTQWYAVEQDGCQTPFESLKISYENFVRFAEQIRG